MNVYFEYLTKSIHTKYGRYNVYVLMHIEYVFVPNDSIYNIDILMEYMKYYSAVTHYLYNATEEYECSTISGISSYWETIFINSDQFTVQR